MYRRRTGGASPLPSRGRRCGGCGLRGYWAQFRNRGVHLVLAAGSPEWLKSPHPSQPCATGQHCNRGKRGRTGAVAICFNGGGSPDRRGLAVFAKSSPIQGFRLAHAGGGKITTAEAPVQQAGALRRAGRHCRRASGFVIHPVRSSSWRRRISMSLAIMCSRFCRSPSARHVFMSRFHRKIIPMHAATARVWRPSPAARMRQNVSTGAADAARVAASAACASMTDRPRPQPPAARRRRPAPACQRPGGTA